MDTDAMAIPALNTASKEFEKWWALLGEWVEIPNQRRGGESGVQRLITPQGELAYSKRQKNHIYRSITHPFGRPTVLREYEAFQAFDALNIPIPELLYCGIQNDGRALFITKALEGFIDLDKWLNHEKQKFSDEVTNQLINKIASITANMHLNKYQHGCLYGKHIFVKATDAPTPSIAITLLDLEKVRRRTTAKKAALHDLEKLRRHCQLDTKQWHYFMSCYEKAFGQTLSSLH